MKVAAAREAFVEAVDQIAPVTIEPSFCLDEVQEQHAREGRERQGVAVGAATRSGEPIGEALQRGAKRLEEARRDGFARERLADS